MSFTPTPDLLASTADEVELLCRVVAPDLHGQPLYVLWCRDIPEAYGEHVIGLQFGAMDVIAKPSLERAGRWQGRGPAFMLNEHVIFRQATKWACVKTTAGTEATFQAIAAVVALHELAHVADEGFRRPHASPAPERIAAMTDRVRIFTSMERPTAPAEVAEENLGHGPRWIRAALHVFSRACDANRWPWPLLPMPETVCDTGNYDLSPTCQYLSALDDEPQRLAGLPLREVLETPAPGAFDELWAADSHRRETGATP